MSAVFQLARWCVPHRAFKGDFQRCQWMHFAGLSSGYWTFYYYSVAFRSIDLDAIVMLCWDHFKLKTFQIITQSFSCFFFHHSSLLLLCYKKFLFFSDFCFFCQFLNYSAPFESCTLVWKHCMYSTQFLPCSDWWLLKLKLQCIRITLCFVH